MEKLPNDILLIIYPELDSHKSVHSLSLANRRFHGVLELNKPRILKRVYARNYAITHPLGHQDAFRLARYMVTNKLPSAKSSGSGSGSSKKETGEQRIAVSQLTLEEIDQLEKNQKVVQYLQDKFLEARRKSKNKATNEELNANEIDKFCQATTRFWLFCTVFAENPRSRVEQKQMVESWCFRTAAELQYIRELILFLWRLLRDAIPESEEITVQGWAEKVGIRCLLNTGRGPADTQWIDFLLSRGCNVLSDLVRQETLLKRILYIAKSPFYYRTDAADYVFICGSAINQVMAEHAASLPTRPYGILDK